MAFFENLQRKWGYRSTVKVSRTSPIWVFLFFFGILMTQNRFVFLYHDDYGYVTLSYAINIWSVRGTNFSLAQLIQFLSEHYTHWGGRILPNNQVLHQAAQAIRSGATLQRIELQKMPNALFAGKMP